MQVTRKILKSTTFQRWLTGLGDTRTRDLIVARIDRLSTGNAGKYRVLDDGIRELKVNYGPGYRIYYTRVDSELLLLIAGGAKSTQSADIKLAANIWKEWRKQL